MSTNRYTRTATGTQYFIVIKSQSHIILVFYLNLIEICYSQSLLLDSGHGYMTLPGPSVPGRLFLDRHSNPNPNPDPNPNPNPIPNPVQELTVQELTVQEVSCN